MKVISATATVTFDEPVDEEEAIQTLGESVLDDGVDVRFVYATR